MAKKETAKNTGKEPWKGIVSKADYEKLTSKMSAKGKKEFDSGFDGKGGADTNFRMSLGATGFYEPLNRQMAKDGEKPLKKDYERWWRLLG